MDKVFIIGDKSLTISIIHKILNENISLVLSDEVKENINTCRNYLDEKIKGSSHPIYGVNTGFGSLCEKKVPEKDLVRLQRNLVISHACGTGDKVPDDIVKIMLLLKIQYYQYLSYNKSSPIKLSIFHGKTNHAKPSFA